MKSIDSEVLASYNAGIEKDRLRTGLGCIEFERTKEILKQMLPSPPAVIYDIGGGYGEYSFWLSSLGYDVHLYDIAEKNIQMAQELSAQYGCKLSAINVADARNIDQPGESVDAILLFGPLYHLVNYSERQLALRECYRLLKPNGLLFTAAISRYATTLWALTVYGVNNTLIDEVEFRDMINYEIECGHHIKNPQSAYTGLGRSYFHLPNELKEEIAASGFVDTDLRGVVGAAWLVPEIDAVWPDETKRENIMKIVRMCEKEESIMGLSTHLLTISRKGCF